jgi:hypothetical protein
MNQKKSKSNNNSSSSAKSGQKQNKSKNGNGKRNMVPKPSLPGRLASAPVAQQRAQRMLKPQMRSQPNGDCRIRHREYIADMVAEATSPSIFKAEGFPVNPGLSGTFPWLSQIAPRFEKYRFDSLKFDFQTEAPTSLGGSVILTVDYDASDIAPTSKVQAMAYKNAVRSAPWEESCHVSAKEDLSQQKAYFVRSAAAPAASDIKLYDVGNLFACSQNIVTGGATLGELYVEYDVLLMTPQLQAAGESGTDSVLFQSNGGATAALPLGSNPIEKNSLASSLLSYDNATSTFTFLRAGVFGLNLYLTGTVITAVSITGTLATLRSTVILASGLGALTASTNGRQAQIGDTIIVSATATTITLAQLDVYELGAFP